MQEHKLPFIAIKTGAFVIKLTQKAFVGGTTN